MQHDWFWLWLDSIGYQGGQILGIGIFLFFIILGLILAGIEEAQKKPKKEKTYVDVDRGFILVQNKVPEKKKEEKYGPQKIQVIKEVPKESGLLKEIK